MRVVGMGTPAFAQTVLKVVSRAHEVVGVLTRPDAVRGRGKRLYPSDVKKLALDLDVPIIECNRINDEVLREVSALEPDVGCVAAFGCLLPKELLDIPRFGCVNVHASLLPRWRGAAPIERAILAGDELTGVSLMRVEEGLDSGPVCLVDAISCKDAYAEALSDELAWRGGYLFLEALDRLEAGDLKWEAQPQRGATYAKRIFPGELDLDPLMSVEDGWRRVRASSDGHPARVLLDATLCRLRRARPIFDKGIVKAGSFALVDGTALLGCADGALAMEALTPAGKRPMEATEWIRGLRTLPKQWKKP